jgi:hypothetical protein
VLLHDHERRETPHAEALDEVWARSLVDDEDAKGPVIPPALQHLGEKSLYPAALSREG